MIRARRALVRGLAALSCASSFVAVAQDSAVVSMGIPPVWKAYAAGEAVFGNTSSGTQLGGSALAGVYKDLLNPMYGALGIAGEGYAGGQGGSFTAGARLMAAIPVLFIQGGADFSFTQSRTDYILSLVFPIQRGGFFHRGGQVRIDWLPTRGQSINVGVQFPLFQPWVGRTRPYDLHVRIPKPAAHPAPDPAIAFDRAAAIDTALDEMRVGAQWLTRLSFVFWDDRGGNYQEGIERARKDITAFQATLSRSDQLHPNGHTFAIEMALYHGALARAFALVSRDTTIARAAYRVMLDDVILPYDRDFGQYRKPETLLGFGEIARKHYAAWLADTALVSVEVANEARHVFAGWLSTLEAVRGATDAQSENDSRLIWLPLQLGLRAQDTDTQAKIDSLLERLVEQRFTLGNATLYLDNEQFQIELARMILATKRYHVLWIHDYAGVNSAGQPDSIGWAQTLVYLRALTRRVRAYDSTGVLPMYIILADAYFTGTNKGPIWLSMLERPLTRHVSLPAAFSHMERALDAEQDSLRAAVAGSKRLQGEAARHGGASWLADRVRVYVNITGPSDLTFRTSHLLGVGFMSDNLIRDHRKIAFRDVTESDPASGEAIYGGVGVGQHYSSSTWEDRALLLSGPALVDLKTRAREALLMNGFAPSQIPPVLRPDSFPEDYDARVGQLVAAGATARAMDAQNRTGFARKDASTSQMALYNLMPPGSVIIVPSSMWTSALWAAQLGSAAMRGCHVYIVAPSARNASVGSKFLLSRQSEIFARLIVMSEVLHPQIAAAGGALHIGIYDRDIDLADLSGGIRHVLAAYAAQPFLREEFPFPRNVYTFLAAAADTLSARGLEGQRLIGDVTKREPLLHRKTQFFATRETLDAIARDSDVIQSFRGMIVTQAAPLRVEASAIPLTQRPERDVLRPLLRAYAELPDSLRAASVMYSAVGSINKDARGVYLDGEVYVLLAGDEALWSWPDYFMMFGWCKWVTTVAAMDSLVPPQGKFTRKIAYGIRRVL